MSKYSMQWLILPDEASKTYTNFDDESPGDVSELVAKVNADPALNQGKTDWRLPRIDELKTLIGTDLAPATGRYWAASPDADGVKFALVVDFFYGSDFLVYKYFASRVRLVRSN